MTRFIKVTSIELYCSELHVCVDSIEEFYRFNPKFSKIEDGEERTRIILKSSNGFWQDVKETVEEIEALINKKR